jgi:flagellar export protein FliJ
MKRFQFRLEQVLNWRRTELDLEEDRLKQLHAALEALDRERSALESTRDEASRSLLSRSTVHGADLQMLAAYQDAVKRNFARLARQRRTQEDEIDRQNRKLLEARKRFRLLEKLKERKLAEWQYESLRQAEADLPTPRPISGTGLRK